MYLKLAGTNIRVLLNVGDKIRSPSEVTYGGRDLVIRIAPDQVWEVTKVCPKTVMIKRDYVEFRGYGEHFGAWEIIEQGEIK